MKLRGKLTLSAGQPIVGVPVSVTSTPRGHAGAPTEETVSTTRQGGRFALTIPRGVSRTLLLSYAGVEDGLPAQRHLRLGVLASSSIKASQRTLTGSGRVKFTGRVRGAGRQLVVVLQGRERGSWRTFADARTLRGGKWRTSYRFSGRIGRYPIRLRIRRQARLPYETGYSRTVVVHVR